MAMTLDLDETEVESLRGALEAYLPALAEEASRTDRIRDAHGLWERYRRLEALKRRLDAGRAGAAESWTERAPETAAQRLVTSAAHAYI
jgi:hypothetical protein